MTLIVQMLEKYLLEILYLRNQIGFTNPNFEVNDHFIEDQKLKLSRLNSILRSYSPLILEMPL